MKDPQRDVPFGVMRSALGTIVLYGAPILAILLVLPKDRITNLGGFLDSIKTVFTVYGGSVARDGTPTLTGFGLFLGHLAAIGFILALVSSGTTWVMGADRSQAMAALDGAAPRVLGTFSKRFGTPIAVNIMSGVVSTIIMILAFTLVHGNSEKYFSAVLGLAISTTTISYLAIFPALSRLRKTHPHVPRPYKVPGGDRGAFVISTVTTAFAALATVALLWPGFGVGWFGTSGKASDALVSLGFKATERLQYELSQFVPLALFLLMGVVFYVAGARTRAHEVQLPIAEEMGLQPVAAADLVPLSEPLEGHHRHDETDQP
jgi:amino acid transporter